MAWRVKKHRTLFYELRGFGNQAMASSCSVDWFRILYLFCYICTYVYHDLSKITTVEMMDRKGLKSPNPGEVGYPDA
jgi:hypothetical protein